MTYARREEIFSKEYIDRKELAELLGINSLSNASNMLTKIKRKVGDRLGVEGRIHVEDYLAYFGIKTDRYVKPIEVSEQISEIQQKHNQIFREQGLV